MYEVPLYVVWHEGSVDTCLNSGEIWCFRPSELVSPRRE